jgi:hypothetical protein
MNEQEIEEEEEIALSYSQSTTDQRNPYGQGEGNCIDLQPTDHRTTKWSVGC